MTSGKIKKFEQILDSNDYPCAAGFKSKEIMGPGSKEIPWVSRNYYNTNLKKDTKKAAAVKDTKPDQKSSRLSRENRLPSRTNKEQKNAKNAKDQKSQEIEKNTVKNKIKALENQTLQNRSDSWETQNLGYAGLEMAKMNLMI